MSTGLADITLTDSLVRRLRALQIAEDRPDLKLRVAVLGGGCSGFQYEFSFAEGLDTGDVRFEKDGVTVIVDETSLELLNGSTIDFADELIGASFQIRNPNAKSACGCGTSFST